MLEFRLCIANFVLEFSLRKRRKEDKVSLDVDFKEDVVNEGGNGDCSVLLEELINSDDDTEISKRAEEYAEDLKKVKVDENGLYDYDEKELYAPIFSDVEIITESYEKEVEDKIEGRV